MGIKEQVGGMERRVCRIERGVERLEELLWLKRLSTGLCLTCQRETLHLDNVSGANPICLSCGNYPEEKP